VSPPPAPAAVAAVVELNGNSDRKKKSVRILPFSRSCKSLGRAASDFPLSVRFVACGSRSRVWCLLFCVFFFPSLPSLGGVDQEESGGWGRRVQDVQLQEVQVPQAVSFLVPPGNAVCLVHSFITQQTDASLWNERENKFHFRPFSPASHPLTDCGVFTVFEIGAYFVCYS
jgi:hypothetical protein